jgi:cellulose biosynthesis protein BcsQ
MYSGRTGDKDVKVLATYNIKGGVGKTATAVNLAYLAALEGAPTLVWDLDPQGAASFYFRIKPKIKGGGKRLVSGKRELEDCIRGTDYEGLDLLPADFSYRNMDLFLEHSKKPSHRLHKLLEPLAGEYDYVFLDCPPSISLVSENVFYAADAVLVPTIPTPLSLRTFRQIRKFLAERDLGSLKVLPFFAMADRDRGQSARLHDRPPRNRHPLYQRGGTHGRVPRAAGKLRGSELGRAMLREPVDRCETAAPRTRRHLSGVTPPTEDHHQPVR